MTHIMFVCVCIYFANEIELLKIAAAAAATE